MFCRTCSVDIKTGNCPIGNMKHGPCEPIDYYRNDTPKKSGEGANMNAKEADKKLTEAMEALRLNFEGGLVIRDIEHFKKYTLPWYQFGYSMGKEYGKNDSD